MERPENQSARDAAPTWRRREAVVAGDGANPLLLLGLGGIAVFGAALVAFDRTTVPATRRRNAGPATGRTAPRGAVVPPYEPPRRTVGGDPCGLANGRTAAGSEPVHDGRVGHRSPTGTALATAGAAVGIAYGGESEWDRSPAAAASGAAAWEPHQPPDDAGSGGRWHDGDPFRCGGAAGRNDGLASAPAWTIWPAWTGADTGGTSPASGYNPAF